MKKILIVGVNFNTYEKLKQYLDSIDIAAKKCPEILVEVNIADNSSKEEFIPIEYKGIKIYKYKFENLGYIGGASAIINKKTNILEYSYVIISNVDIVFDENTLKNLFNVELDSNIAWVAPKILSRKDGKNKNPSIINRYSKLKLSLLKFTYNRYVFCAYKYLYYRRKKTRRIDFPEQEIYAGHGSCFILTNSFFVSYREIHFPLFLYGEELFFAELIREVHKKVLYCPRIEISDFENASTSKLPSKTYFKLNKEAIDYILKEFYHNQSIEKK